MSSFITQQEPDETGQWLTEQAAIISRALPYYHGNAAGYHTAQQAMVQHVPLEFKEGITRYQELRTLQANMDHMDFIGKTPEEVLDAKDVMAKLTEKVRQEKSRGMMSGDMYTRKTALLQQIFRKMIAIERADRAGMPDDMRRGLDEHLARCRALYDFIRQLNNEDIGILTRAEQEFHSLLQPAIDQLMVAAAAPQAANAAERAPAPQEAPAAQDAAVQAVAEGAGMPPRPPGPPHGHADEGSGSDSEDGRNRYQAGQAWQQRVEADEAERQQILGGEAAPPEDDNGPPLQTSDLGTDEEPEFHDVEDHAGPVGEDDDDDDDDDGEAKAPQNIDLTDAPIQVIGAMLQSEDPRTRMEALKAISETYGSMFGSSAGPAPPPDEQQAEDVEVEEEEPREKDAVKQEEEEVASEDRTEEYSISDEDFQDAVEKQKKPKKPAVLPSDWNSFSKSQKKNWRKHHQEVPAESPRLTRAKGKEKETVGKGIRRTVVKAKTSGAGTSNSNQLGTALAGIMNGNTSPELFEEAKKRVVVALKEGTIDSARAKRLLAYIISKQRTSQSESKKGSPTSGSGAAMSPAKRQRTMGVTKRVMF